MPIFEQTYQHWQGQLSGHGWRWFAISRHGIRVAAKSLLLKILIVFSWLPALALAAALCIWSLAEQNVPWAMGFVRGILPGAGDLSTYRYPIWTLCFSFYLGVQMWFVAFVMLIVGPGLISQDLRFNAFPLYFSRPVRRNDYFLGKLCVIGFYLFLVTVVPAVIAWVLGVMVSLSFSVAVDTLRILGAVVLQGAIVTLSAGLLMLAISSLSRSSVYVGLIWIGFFLLASIVSSVLVTVHTFSVIFKHQNDFVRVEDHEMPAGKMGGNDQAAMEKQERRLKEEARQRRKNMREAMEELKNDWRQCVSYRQDLLRIGDELLGCDEAKAKLTRATNRRRNMADDMNEDDEQVIVTYPWYWSGYILLGMGGLSIWILHTRVKTLDRLR